MNSLDTSGETDTNTAETDATAGVGSGARSEALLPPGGPIGAEPSARRPLVEPNADTTVASPNTATVETTVDATVDATVDTTVGGAGSNAQPAPATHTFKILVTGPFAAGKTSLIQAVSQTAVVSTDVITSGEESDVKAHTTVAMDFGTYQLDDDGISLLLFGTPGQPRFRFMTNILKGDVDIVAFVIDAEARQTHAAAGVELRSLLSDLRVPAVIAVNRCDDQDVADRMARSLGALAGESVVPCQLVDPGSGRDVIIEILLTLLNAMESTAATTGKEML